MARTMRAKMQVISANAADHDDQGNTTMEVVGFMAVCGTDPFGPNGESEDNTYARYTPNGTLSLSITNPELIGSFKYGQKYYLDFTPAEQ